MRAQVGIPYLKMNCGCFRCVCQRDKLKSVFRKLKNLVCRFNFKLYYLLHRALKNVNRAEAYNFLRAFPDDRFKLEF